MNKREKERKTGKKQSRGLPRTHVVSLHASPVMPSGPNAWWLVRIIESSGGGIRTFREIG